MARERLRHRSSGARTFLFSCDGLHCGGSKVYKGSKSTFGARAWKRTNISRLLVLTNNKCANFCNAVESDADNRCSEHVSTSMDDFSKFKGENIANRVHFHEGTPVVKFLNEYLHEGQYPSCVGPGRLGATLSKSL